MAPINSDVRSGMRSHGNLTKWNEDRGFGFITPAGSTGDIFVHISAFPRGGQRPAIGELISYETETTPDGKKRAIRVMRPGRQATSRRGQRNEQPDRDRGVVGTIVAMCVVTAIGYFIYTQYFQESLVPFAAAASQAGSNGPRFKCDGRTMCSQMTSCAEATYFIQHCPNTKMDGNRDGEPCEQQWCTQ